MPLGLTSAVSAKEAAIQKKMYGSGMSILIISNEKMEDVIKTVKSFGDPGLLVKGVSETIQNEAKQQKGEFLCMLLVTLGASLLGNLLTGRGVKANIPGWGVITAGEGAIATSQGRSTIRAVQDF